METPNNLDEVDDAALSQIPLPNASLLSESMQLNNGDVVNDRLRTYVNFGGTHEPQGQIDFSVPESPPLPPNHSSDESVSATPPRNNRGMDQENNATDEDSDGQSCSYDDELSVQPLNEHASNPQQYHPHYEHFQNTQRYYHSAQPLPSFSVPSDAQEAIAHQNDADAGSNAQFEIPDGFTTERFPQSVHREIITKQNVWATNLVFDNVHTDKRDVITAQDDVGSTNAGKETGEQHIQEKDPKIDMSEAKPSDEVVNYMGKNIVKSIDEKNKTSMRVFKTYIFSSVDLSGNGCAVEHANWKTYAQKLNINVDNDLTTFHKESEVIRRVMFPNDKNDEYLPNGYSEWSEKQLKHIRYFLREFVTGYRKEDGYRVQPSTMKGYIFGLQRFFEEEWEYKLSLTTGPVFACQKRRLVIGVEQSVLRTTGKWKRHSQSQRSHKSGYFYIVQFSGLISCHSNWIHNSSDIQCVISYSNAAKRDSSTEAFTGKGNRTRRGGSYKNRGYNLGNSGTSKNSKGGFKAVKKKPKQIILWNKEALDGTLNVFEDIKSYLQLRNSFEMKQHDNDRYLSATNPKATHKPNFFKAQPLGIHKMRSLIKEACIASNITGLGDNPSFNWHGIRGTVITFLVETSRSAPSIQLKSGHKQAEGLLPYSTTGGEKGKVQQDIAFRGASRSALKELESPRNKFHRSNSTEPQSSANPTTLNTTDPRVDLYSASSTTVNVNQSNAAPNTPQTTTGTLVPSMQFNGPVTLNMYNGANPN